MKKSNISRSYVHPETLHNSWRDFASSEEIQRLAVLDGRIDRQKKILADTVKDRVLIRSRLIRRMRRATGKE
jgi:hypothetical protein